MDNTTIYLGQNPLTKNTPYRLEFLQLKEYFNFRRKFKTDKVDKSKQGKIIQNQYYLIDKNWLLAWKEIVGYQKFHNINLNRDALDSDYNTFKLCLPPNINLLRIAPLDNSKIYNQKGEINPLAEFIIVNKECLNIFAESRQNKTVDKIEKSCPLMFLSDKIILIIDKYTRLICYRDEVTKNDMEIIVKFKNEKNIEQILNDIINSKIKDWLEKRNFHSIGPDELDINEKGCQIKLINKNLKLIIKSQRNRIDIQSNTTKFFKYNLPQELKNEIQYQAQEIFRNTQANFFKPNNNNSNNVNGINQNQNQNKNFAFNQNQNQNFNQFNQFQNNNNPNNFINGNNNMNNLNNCPNNNCIQSNNNMNINRNNFGNMNLNNNNMLGLNNIPSCNNMQIMSMQNINNQLNLNLNNNNSSPNMQVNPGKLLNNQMPNQVPSRIQSAAKENIFTSGINYPHKAGLLNVGQSCYMNATIQCLSNIKGLSHNILLNFGTFDQERQPLCLAYSNLIYELLHTRDKYINPQVFKNVIGGLNPLFEGNQAADAKDLIFFIIETLHKELLPPPMNNAKEIDFFQQEMNSNNEQIVFQNFITELSANQTIVSNIFYGAIRTVMVCKGCKRNKFSFQTFNLLIFPLKKVKDFKLAKIGGKKNINLDLNLYDAFSCEQEVEKLEGENMIYCNFCRQLSPGTHKQDYYSFPRILIIILNRGKNNQDFNEPFRFDETLDFSNMIKHQNSCKKYFLCGIITHLGKSGSDGHFIAYCRNNINDNFTCYNDAGVSQVGVTTAMETKISKLEIEKKTPYILLYHYMK